MNLLEKYRPKALADLLGQPWAVEQLTRFADDPSPCAFLFEGDTGTGKTSAAILLAQAIGVDVEKEEFGGLYQIASGEQTGVTVRKILDGLRCRPWFGSGWRVLIVNEADDMTSNAAMTWLDALESLPLKTVVVFTTNNPRKLPPRLRDRCERLAFESSFLLLQPCLQELIDRIWQEEGCEGMPPAVTDLGVCDENGQASFRRLLQRLTPFVRVGATLDEAPQSARLQFRKGA